MNDGELAPWDGSDAKQLSLLLAAKPDLDEKKFAVWLYNYARSDVTRGDRPRVFLSRLPSYANGPLNQYGKEKRYAESKDAALARHNREVLDRVREKKRAASENGDAVLEGDERGVSGIVGRTARSLLGD